MPTPVLLRAPLWRRLTGRLLPALVLVLVAGVAALTFATPAQAAPAPSAPATEPAAPVLLVGVTGLRWDDVTTLTTPALWNLSREGAIGLVAARSVAARSCPVDGWLVVSTGTRAADAPAADRTCRTLRGPAADGVVPGWTDYVDAAANESYGAEPGMLGDVLSAAGTPVTGLGPGAAIALADSTGHVVGTHAGVPTTASGITRAVRDALSASTLVVLDGGSIRDPGFATTSRPEPAATEQPMPELPGVVEPEPEVTGPDAITEPTRASQVQAMDDRIGAALIGARKSGATVLVVSLADSGRATLQLAAATGTAPNGAEYSEDLLTSGSTRQKGLVQSVDVTPTLLDGIGLDDAAAALTGAEMLPTSGPATATGRLAYLIDMQRHASLIGRLSAAYSTRLVLVQAVLFLAAAVILTRKGRSDKAPLRPALRVLWVGAVALAAAPVASFLTNVVPWWRSDRPVTSFWWTLIGWIALITVAALVGPWRKNLLGPAGLVSGVTVAVLVIDACTGSTLVIDSPMGAHRLLAARFYGMSNQAFALLTAGGLLLAVAVADPLLRRGRRRLATWFVALLGLLLVVVDGTPGLGSDFGGPPALILAFAMLTIVVSGRKVNWKTLALIAVVGVAVVAGFAVLDWLRPPEARTHLGRFFATVLDGGLWDVVGRKISVNLRVLTSWRYLVLAIGGVALTWLVIAGGRPRRGSLMGTGGSMAGLRQAVPLLRPAVAAIAAALGVGFLMNDSGIVVPATGIALAVPCLVAAAAQWRLGAPEGTVPDEVTAPPSEPAPPEPTPADPAPVAPAPAPAP